MKKKFIRYRQGVSLVEVLFAVAILGFGFLPIFVLLSDSRRISTKSIEEMQGISMTSSMIDGLKRCPTAELLKCAGQQFSDRNLPAGLQLQSLGVPIGPTNLERFVEWRLLNQPLLPQERFSNPWGRILEIHVSIQRAKDARKGENLPRGTVVHEARGYVKIHDSE